MSEWGSVVAVFWILYLADGVGGGRRERLFLSSWRGGVSWCFWRGWGRLFRWRRARSGVGGTTSLARPARTASLTQASWHFAPPWPWAYALALDDLPGSLSAEGAGNWPSVSTARPPPLPDALRAVRWQDVEKTGAAGGWLMIDGRRFAPATLALDARGLKELAERLRPLGPDRRAAVIAAWHARRFSVLRARRRFSMALRRTRGLAAMNTLQVLGWLALSFGLLSGAFSPVSPQGDIAPWRHLDSRQAPWWILVGWLLLTHVLVVFQAWSLHRRLHPNLKEDRANLIFSVLMLPPQALRLRAALLKPLGRGLAPLAGALAVGTPRTARAAAEATLRDAEHPLRPPTLPPLMGALADDATGLIRPALERALADALANGAEGLNPDRLLAPPARFERDVCAYCPRCGDGFVRADGACPHGVKLCPLPAK